LLIAKLRKLKSNQNGISIQNLKSYTTSVTINAYQQYLRKKYPLRQQLKNKLRYLLTHHPDFSLRESENHWICGFKQNSGNFKSFDLEQILTEITDLVNQKNLREESKIIDLTRTLFDFLKQPILFNDLLALVAEIQDIKDKTEILQSNEFLPNNYNITENKILTKLEQQESLKQIWLEIQKLSVRHRLALLLNLKDTQGNCMIHFFPLLRIATIRQIAELLEFPPEEFANIWRELPWDDLRIAEYLGLNRQQIINLRQSARARLVRQLKDL
jgi:hypothetical protein